MNYLKNTLIIISVIITFFFHAHVYLGKEIPNGENGFFSVTRTNKSSEVNNLKYMKNPKNVKKIKNRPGNQEKYMNRNNITKKYFINNYKPQYKIFVNKTTNVTVRNSHNIYYDNIKNKNKNIWFDAITRKTNKGKEPNTIFTLFNSINDNLKTFHDDVNNNDNANIVDDVSSLEENIFNLQNKDKDKDKEELLNTKEKEKNLINDITNITKSEKCSFLKKIVEGGKTISLLSLWYTCNILYNIENKKALNILNLPITISITQIAVGMPIFIIPWILRLRKKPELYYNQHELNQIHTSDKNRIVKMFQRYNLFLKTYNSIIKQSIYHGYVHLLSVIAMGAGAISFVHIVKALEPLFASVFSFFLLNNRMSVYTYFSLLPIIFGVSLASVKELSFTYKALYSTLLANIFSTMRGIEAKKMMSKDLKNIGKNLTPANIFAMLTVFSIVFLTPALFLDAFKWKDSYYYLINNNINVNILLRHIVMSGVWFYLYNELSFIALHRLNNISHAVANTVKRIFLILTSFFIFGTKFSFLGGLGSSIAVGGTLLYSLSKHKFG